MWLSQSVIPSSLLLYPPQHATKGIPIACVSSQLMDHVLHGAVFKKKQNMAGMRACLPCPDCYILGQVQENNFSKSNGTYPSRKAGSCKKGATGYEAGGCGRAHA